MTLSLRSLLRAFTFRNNVQVVPPDSTFRYRIENVTLDDGFTISPGDLTVIVGPNNSGKSRFLKDLLSLASGKRAGTIISEARFSLPISFESLCAAYEPLVRRLHDKSIGGSVWRHLGSTLVKEEQNATAGKWPESFKSEFMTRRTSQQHFGSTYGKGLVAYINTEDRLRLIKESPSQSEDNETANLLQAMYSAGKPAEMQLREEVKRAFHTEVALDFTVPRRLMLRVGSGVDELPADPRDAKQMMNAFPPLDEQGDGLRSYAGAVAAMIISKRPLILFDEPEAFLHPPQAYLLGEFIARHAGPDRQVVVATHSADVLRGIIGRRQDLLIVRVDRMSNAKQFRTLSVERVTQIARDPLLSTARVLEGLFYEAAVIVEAESDARLYMTATQKRSPGSDVHFVNADNKQTVPKIMQPYREMGVRCIGIVDFDVLSDPTEFRKQLEVLPLSPGDFTTARELAEKIAKHVDSTPIDQILDSTAKLVANCADMLLKAKSASLSEKERTATTVRRDAERIKSQTSKWKTYKEHGRNALPPTIQAYFDELHAICLSGGLLINPAGELESLLTEYGVSYSTQKNDWIQRAITLVPNLDVNDAKPLWAIRAELEKHLSPPLKLD
jgi:ABC-type Mn2+/Zn2+ transport system ATPase subunit